MSIRKIFEEELADLKVQLVEMCRLTEQMIKNAITALINRDRELGKSIGEAGMPYDEICKSITQYIKRTGLLFMLKSLKSLANNGRVSPIAAKIVGIVGIGVVGKASNEGTLEQMHKCRGERKALETIVTDLEAEGFRSGKISIGHCRNESAALQLKELILSKFKNAMIEIHKLRGLCSFYAENGGVLVGFEKAPV